MGSKSKKILAACGSHTGVRVKTSLVSEYRSVYDEMITKPTGLDKYVQNKICRDLVSKNYWNRTDYMNFYFAHTNDNGEALFNYKQPAGGGSLVDTGKGKFNTDIETVTPWTNNVVEWESVGGLGTMKCTYVDDAKGFILNLGDSFGDLNTDLTAGKTYKIQVKCKTNSGLVRLQVYDGSATISGNDIGTDWEWHEIIFVCVNPNACRLQTKNFDATEIIWLDQYYIQEWSNATAYNSPVHTLREGFLGNGINAYINNHFNPAVSGINYVQNSGSILIGCFNDISEDRYIAGCTDAVNYLVHRPRSVSNNTTGMINSGAVFHNAANGNSKKHFSLRRTSANDVIHGINKVHTAGSVASSGVPDLDLHSLAYNNNGVSAGWCINKLMYLIIMDGLTNDESDEIQDIMESGLVLFGKGLMS